MADALLFADARKSRSHTRVHWNFLLLLDLLAPALLLGMARAWTSVAAPRMDIYFSAEALLIVYAYFALIRAVHIHSHSYDRAGRYSKSLALIAARNFWHGLQRYWLKIAVGVLSLLVAALGLDLLTAHSGIQNRPNVHLTILFIEIMVWARYGAAIMLASARWTPPQPPEFAQARELAGEATVARSFAGTTLGFGLTALAAVACYKWLGAGLPSAQAETVVSALLFAGLALLALWLQCRWARRVAPALGERSLSAARELTVPRAA